MTSAIVPRAGTELYDSGRDLVYVKPRLRGWLHLMSFAGAVAVGAVLITMVRGSIHTADAAIYSAAVAGLFGTSALYHRGRWAAKMAARLQRMDHLMIIVLIAGSATVPIQVCAPGHWKLIGLVVLWSLATAAIIFRLVWMSAPERLVGAIYIGLGWVAGAAIPAVWVHSGVAPAVLILVGGLLYSAGAIGYHRRRPDPYPTVFGYHEVFHSYVTAAAACHYVAIACFIL